MELKGIHFFKPLKEIKQIFNQLEEIAIKQKVHHATHIEYDDKITISFESNKKLMEFQKLIPKTIGPYCIFPLEYYSYFSREEY
jgi:hypothetical protein